MAETIEYEQFEGHAPGEHNGAGGALTDLSRLSDIPMELSVEIGRTHMTVGETLDLRVGSVVALERLAGETADLLVNGSAIARGEVVVIDEQYGLRITEILEEQADGASSPEGEQPATAQDAPRASIASPDQADATNGQAATSATASSPEGEQPVATAEP
jgi:flagellar motor switch protein FliN